MKIVRVTAIWCMSCLLMRNRYDTIFKAYDIKQIIDLDFDEDDVTPYDIGQILPVVIVYKDDKEIMRIQGEKSKKELKKIFESLV